MTQAVADCMSPGLHGTTFGGGPLACAAALAALDAIDEERLIPHAAEVGEYIAARMRDMQARVDTITAVRGMGLMIGVQLSSGDIAKSVVSGMLDRGIIINRTHESVLRFLPPYIVQQQHADEMLSVLEQVLVRESNGALVGVAAESAAHG
ncbi:MAG: hypothetical protein NVS9B15_09210 [Acidobacteriaceae bacterium]